MSDLHAHTFDNGLTLVAECIPSARSLAFNVLTPAGVAAEPADQLGVAGMLSEMLFRGAGDRDARAHSDALDQLGVQRDSHVDMRRLRLGATMIADNFDAALPLLADMLLQPTLADASLEPTRDLALQAIETLADEPQQRVFIDLRARHFPAPLGRSSLGEARHIEAMTIDQVREFWKRCCVPDGSIIGVAGRFEWDALRDRIGEQFGDWTGSAGDVEPTDEPRRGYTHQKQDTKQVHIGIAYDAVPESHADVMLQKAAIAVLSGGMSGRLFTEVREKRGLCYAVGARYGGDKKLGVVLSYAGTTVPRAQETYDVLTGELKRISDGVQSDEFERAIVGMKSSLVMQGESTSARAAAIAADQYVFGRPRSLDELASLVDAVTLERLNNFVAARRADPMTVVTIGPDALKV